VGRFGWRERLMEPLQWDDSLSVGVELIDEQHKMWIQRLNEVSAAVDSRQGPKEIAKTLGFLVGYTDYHFSTEEKHMVANSYPGLVDHQAKHGELKVTLAHLVEGFEEEGATHLLADFIETFLRNWLTGHIRQVDQRFGAFLRDKGISLPAES
jgi:hemerythrin